MRHLNDNVFQNIEHRFMGVKKYNIDDESARTKKDPLQFDEKEEIAGELYNQKTIQE